MNACIVSIPSNRALRRSIELSMKIQKVYRVLIRYSSNSYHNRMVSAQETLSSGSKRISPHSENNSIGSKDNQIITNGSGLSEYDRAICDLNSLQSNTRVIALAKYRNPELILPLFKKQLKLAGMEITDLERLDILHIGGTKGKGSTCALTESILRCAGLKTGFYNSPHLVKVTERIQLNGRPIDECQFAKYFRVIYDRLSEGTKREDVSMPSYFSFLTILAFHVFLEESVDCAIMEVGMGGEYDPTNIIERPVACGITTLDLDHTNVLGRTIENIAWNKAGIIKSGVPTFTVQHEQPEAMKVIEKRAQEKGAPLHVCEPISSNDLVSLGIKSSAQYVNASLACQLANCLFKRIGADSLVASKSLVDTRQLPEHFIKGLENCRWPGRCQIVEFGNEISFFLDGAHTKKSMENCLEWFLSSSRSKSQHAQRVLMINVIGDRDRVEVLKPLTKYNHFDYVIFSTNRINSLGDTARSETFINLHGHHHEKSLDNVLKNAQIWTNLTAKPVEDSKTLLKPNTCDAFMTIEKLVNKGKECHVLATGSLHFVGAVLETIQIFRKSE